MTHADIDDRNPKRIVVHTAYVDRERIKQVPGMTWSAKDSAWKGPLSWSTYVVLYNVFKPNIDFSDRLAEWIRDEYDNRVKPAEALREVKSFTDAIPDSLPRMPAATEVVRAWPTRGRTA